MTGGDGAPAVHLEPLAGLIGRWRTSGSVLDEQGSVSGEVAGTDTYAWAPGGQWIVHEVDVRVAGDRVQSMELIGGAGPTGAWDLYSFGAQPAPETTRLGVHAAGALLLEGDGVRSWLRPEAGPEPMTAQWERYVDDTWRAWMYLRFDRRA